MEEIFDSSTHAIENLHALFSEFYLHYGQLTIVCVLLIVTIMLFCLSKLRMDIIALLVITSIVMTGVLTPAEALSGLSDPNIVLLALLFVIGEGLVRTGISFQISDYILRVAGNNEIRIIVLIMLAVSLLGSVMSSIGVVAIFIPVVISIAKRAGLHVKRLMMPLCIAALISGMMTLVATAPNLVVNSELKRLNLSEFGFFTITPIGLSIMIIGITYSVLTRSWLLNKAQLNPIDETHTRRKMTDLIRDYKLAGRAHRASIKKGSWFIGNTLENLDLKDRYGVSVIGIERWRRFRKVMIPVNNATEFRENDTLLIDVSHSDTDIRRFLAENQLEPKILRGEYFSDQAKEVGMAEVVLLPRSILLGQTLKEINFHANYRVSVIGMRRHHRALKTNLAEKNLHVGDTLLVCGDWRSIEQLKTYTNDFVLLDLPAEIDDVAPASSQAIPALLILALMVALMASRLVPNVIAALLACLLMGATRCLDIQSAYRAIQWPSLLLIVGMMPFAIALEKTGGISLVSEWLKGYLQTTGPYVVLAFIFLLCSTIGLFISNTATAILVAPIAINLAVDFGYSPYPYAMCVAIATSASFITPVSSPIKTMIVAPGGYSFGDFVKIGVPLTFLVLIVTVLIVPIVLPF